MFLEALVASLMLLQQITVTGPPFQGPPPEPVPYSYSEFEMLVVVPGTRAVQRKTVLMVDVNFAAEVDVPLGVAALSLCLVRIQDLGGTPLNCESERLAVIAKEAGVRYSQAKGLVWALPTTLNEVQKLGAIWTIFADRKIWIVVK